MRVIEALAVLSALVCVQCEAPDGYIVNKVASKAYKVMYQSQTWHKAQAECTREGASLAVPSTQEEFQFLQRLVRGMYYPHITGTQYKLLVWLGINNLEDYTVWRNVDGENIEFTNFHKWASNDIGFSDDPKEPHCAGMDAANPGLRIFWCHLRQPYICQINVEPFGPPSYNNLNEALEH